jgi:ribosomal RNA-processing protein 17
VLSNPLDLVLMPSFVIQQRRILAEQAAQNAAEVEEAYGGVVRRTSRSYLLSCPSSAQAAHMGVKLIFRKITGIEPYGDEQWTGITPSSSGAGAGDPEHDVEAERRKCEYSYSDEEQLATVTVVEDFDPSALHLLHGSVAPDERSSPLPPARHGRIQNEVGDGAVRKRKDMSAKNKVRYETKAARRAAQTKQHARKAEKAERAGGKAARRTKAGGKKRKKIPMG